MGDVTGILLMIPPLLFALTFHEFSHAYVATRLADPTARLLGRLTLNPIAHLDVVGTLVFVMTQRIGWAKPRSRARSRISSWLSGSGRSSGSRPRCR